MQPVSAASLECTVATGTFQKHHRPISTAATCQSSGLLTLQGRLDNSINPKTRLKLGVALLVIGLITPFGAFLVAGTNWPPGVKTVVSGILVLGFEILMFPAIALMGKENFDRIVGRVKSLLKMLKPAGNVSRSRYTVGLMLLVVPILLSWIISYFPSWIPGGNASRLWVNLGLDLTVAASLFVLGGDFWDKLRALFHHDAKVIFSASAGGEAKTVSA